VPLRSFETIVRYIAGTATAAGLRVAALDALTGLREVRAFGAEVDESPDGLRVVAGRALSAPARVSTEGDHRIGMSAAILALGARSPILIDDADCIATSFPGFADAWRDAFC